MTNAHFFTYVNYKLLLYSNSLSKKQTYFGLGTYLLTKFINICHKILEDQI